MSHSAAIHVRPGPRVLDLLVIAALAASLLIPLSARAATGDPVLLNEVLVSHTGMPDNTEFVELYGTPGASLTGLSLLVVEGDSGGVPGTVDGRVDFASDARLGGNGFFLLGNPVGLAAHYHVVPDLALGDDSFENGSQTLALVSTASAAAVGDPLTGGEVVLDTVGLADTGPTDAWFFGAPVVGPDDGFLAAGARRVTDGIDTDAAADWVIADDLLGTANTPTPATPFNAPPTADCGSAVQTDAGTATSTSVSASDPDGRVVSFGLSVSPDPATVTLGTTTPAITPGGSATVDLLVSASTPAGNYTAEVTAWTDDAVPQQATCEVAVTVKAAPGPTDATMDDLGDMLDGYLADGSVDGAKAHLLVDRLDRAARFADNGQTAAARAQLQAFGNQLMGLSPHWVTQPAADALWAEAALVDAALGA